MVTKLPIDAGDENADWLKEIVNPKTGKTYREQELALHEQLATKNTKPLATLTSAIKHLPGRHDQRTHTPYRHRGGAEITLGGVYEDIKMRSVFWHQNYNKAIEKAHELGAGYVAKYWIGDHMYHVMKLDVDKNPEPSILSHRAMLSDITNKKATIDTLVSKLEGMGHPWDIHVDKEAVLNSDVAARDFQNLGAISEGGWSELLAAGGQVYFGDGNVTELDDNAYLAGEHPRGWPVGSTFEQVRGCAKGKYFFVGTRGEGGTNQGMVGLHEAGHAFGSLSGIDHGLRWEVAYGKAKKAGGLNPYLLQEGNAGLEESWAEAFAAVQRAKYVGKHIALDELGLTSSNQYEAYGILYDAAEQIVAERGW